MIKQHFDEIGEKLFIFKLKNGMEVHVMPKEDPAYSTYVEVSIPYGALDLIFEHGGNIYETPYGTAHFLEHQIFAMPDGDAFSVFSKLGVDANAMTSYNQTSYLFQSTENFDQALLHLLKMLDTPYFMKEAIDKEKLIIGEELKMYLDQPKIQMQNELMEMLYHHHPLKYDIGGTLESILDVDQTVLNQVYHAFYHPKNRLMVITGKVDIDALKRLLKAYDQMDVKPYVKPKTIQIQEPKKLVDHTRIYPKNIGIDKIMLGVKLTPQSGNKKEKLRQELALSILMSMILGPSSLYYQELFEEKLINHNFFFNINFEKGAENIIIYGESKRVKRLKVKLILMLTQDLESILSETVFDRFKKSYLGQFIYTLNSIETKAYYYGKYIHAGSSLFEVIDMLNTITYEDIKAQSKRIHKRYIATLIHKKA